MRRERACSVEKREGVENDSVLRLTYSVIIEKSRDDLVTICFEGGVNSNAYSCEVFKEGIVALDNISRGESSGTWRAPLSYIGSDRQVVWMQRMTPNKFVEPALCQVIAKLLFGRLLA